MTFFVGVPTDVRYIRAFPFEIFLTMLKRTVVRSLACMNPCVYLEVMGSLERFPTLLTAMLGWLRAMKDRRR